MGIFDNSGPAFLSFFQSPTAGGILLAIAFGILWLAPFLPPLHRRYWLWAVMVVSAFLTLAAIAYVQTPLQILASQGLHQVWTEAQLAANLLLAGIPVILLSGLVQEGAKLLPMMAYRRFSGGLTPKQGLVLGAVAGAGFGIFEAQWVLNIIFNASSVGESFIGVWERISAVALHTGASALAGWLLVKGKGWLGWLAASLAHAAVNYSVVLLQAGLLGYVGLELYATVIALAVLGLMLWVRWHGRDDDDETAADEVSEVEA